MGFVSKRFTRLPVNRAVPACAAEAKAGATQKVGNVRPTEASGFRGTEGYPKRRWTQGVPPNLGSSAPGNRNALPLGCHPCPLPPWAA